MSGDGNPEHRPSEAGEPVRRRQTDHWTVELLPRRAYVAHYTPPGPVIGFSFDSQSGMHAFASGRVTPFRTYPNGLAFVPAGCDVYSRSEEGGEYLSVLGAPDTGNTAPFSDRTDPAAILLAHNLRRLLLGAADPDPLLLGELAAALAERALSLVPDAVAPDAVAPGIVTARRLTPARLKRVCELIDDRLDEQLSVAMLADAVGLSEASFSRAFRAATGVPPHAYLRDRRIARARSLIVTTRRDLDEIALDCGFSSHAHMTAGFRQRLGIAPSALRRTDTR